MAQALAPTFVNGAPSPRELRRKVGIGAFIGRRSSGPGIDLKMQMVQVPLPAFYRPANWSAGSYQLGNDIGVTLDLVDKSPFEFSSSTLIYSWSPP